MTEKEQSSGKIKILVIGISPLPHENVKKSYAGGIRTWNFAKSAKNENTEVMIIGSRTPFAYDGLTENEKFEKIDEINYLSVSPELFENKNWLENKINEFEPDCIVAVNTYPCSIVSNLEIKVPFWADLNGGVMAEAQAKAYVYDDDKYLQHFFNMEKKVLGKADVFSVVSEPQGFSLLGELGVWGRLNKNTMGYRMVRVVPNTMTSFQFKHSKNIIRGKKTKQDAFIVLYSGGYNTWTDIHTMFRGLEKAMAINPDITFVSTGGAIDGHDEITYKEFNQLIDASKFSDRFILCGWVPKEDLENYYFEADLAINSDKYCYESILGARTRILDWIQIPLPLISTPLSEITSYLVKKGLALGFPPGNSDELSEKLVYISQNPNVLKKIKQSLEKIKDEFTETSTLKELREWTQNPIFSPDHGKFKPLMSPEKTDSIESISKTENMAITLWPKIVKIMNILHLQRFENNFKKFGYGLVTKDAPVYKAKFTPVSLSILETNNKYKIPVVIKNIGNISWQNHTESANSVNLSYIWKNTSNNEIIKLEERTTLPKSIKPNERFEVNMKLTTPKKEGEYTLEIDLVKEHEFWFSEMDSTPMQCNVEIKKKLEPKRFPKVSVIVVSYNSQGYIGKCIESLLSSDYPDFEILLVDNNSKDETLNEIKDYKEKIKLIPNKINLGFGGGNNLAIKQSVGEIIVMINPDAYVRPNSISELVKPLLTNNKSMISGSKILYPDTNIIQSAGGIIQNNGLTNHLGYKETDNGQHDYLCEVDYITGAAMAIKKVLFEKTGLFDSVYFPAYYEETEKCTQARNLGFKVIYQPSSVVFHHESTTLGALSDSFLHMFHTSRFKFVYRNFHFSKILFKFFPSEITWFIKHCPIKEKKIVIKSNLKAMFSKRVILKSQIALD